MDAWGDWNDGAVPFGQIYARGDQAKNYQQNTILN
jgi:hypothetical protein